jgi:anti-anti-sigma factor
MIINFPNRHDPEKFEEIKKLFSQQNAVDSFVIIDLSKVFLISSSGLSLLIKIYKHCNFHKIPLKLTHPTKSFLEILGFTNLESFFTIER